MHRNSILLIFLFLLSNDLLAQYFKLSGTITNNKLEPLALVSIQVKDYKIGTISKEDGTFELELEAGNYDLVVTMVDSKAR
jgi:hypothetical protein